MRVEEWHFSGDQRSDLYRFLDWPSFTVYAKGALRKYWLFEKDGKITLKEDVEYRRIVNRTAKRKKGEIKST